MFNGRLCNCVVIRLVNGDGGVVVLGSDYSLAQGYVVYRCKFINCFCFTKSARLLTRTTRLLANKCTQSIKIWTPITHG